MKNLFLTVFLIAILCSGCSSDDNKKNLLPEDFQITLYDKNKEAIAYIDYRDDATIYTFEGEPVAYIESEEQVYGFNGKFLGWYYDGVLYDKTYYAVGAKHGIARGGINTVSTRPEKIKGTKHLRPFKPVTGTGYERPVLKDSWSEILLTEFFTRKIMLCDKNKEAIAYIDYNDDASIYTFEGEPVAYIYNEEEIYNFDGKFLGWYFNGIVYDKNALSAVGAKYGVSKGNIHTEVITLPEKTEGVKHTRPTKSAREVAPVRPILDNNWSTITLMEFFTKK